MKKSFTLIEILISVFIIAMVMAVVLKITSNTKNLFLKSKNYNSFALKASVASIEGVKGKNVYDMLRDFSIRNDNIINHLKQEKLNVKKTPEYSQIENFNNTQINTGVYKLKIYNKYYSILLYEPYIK